MKKFRRISIMLALCLIFSMIPVFGVSANGAQKLVFEIGSAEAEPGTGNIQIPIHMKNNTIGIASVQLDVTYDDTRVALEKVSFNKDWEGMTMPPQFMKSPARLSWFDGMKSYTAEESDFAVLTFRVLDNAPAGDAAMTMTYDPENIYDITETNLNPDIVNGKITVLGEKPAELFEIDKTSTRLGNNLSLNFAFQQANIHGQNYFARVIHAKADGTSDILDIPQINWTTTSIDGVDYYVVEYTELAAKEMADSVSIQVYHGDNTAASKVKNSSIRDYAKDILSGTEPVNVKTLIVDMLNYGAEAQTYFNYAANDLANKNLTAEQKQFGTQQDPICQNYLVANEEYLIGSALRLDNNINLMFRLKNVTSDMSARLTFADKVVTIPGSDFRTDNEYFVVDLNELVVADGRELVTCEILSSDGKVLGTFKDSVESYASRAPQEVKPVTNAFMKFSDSACVYLGK